MICNMSIFAHVGSMPSLVSGHAEHMLISKMNTICYVALAFLFTYEGVSHLISIFGKFYACFEGKTYFLAYSEFCVYNLFTFIFY